MSRSPVPVLNKTSRASPAHCGCLQRGDGGPAQQEARACGAQTGRLPFHGRSVKPAPPHTRDEAGQGGTAHAPAPPPRTHETGRWRVLACAGLA